MSQLLKDIKYFWKHRCFSVGIPLMMVFSYVTLLLNPTVGVDDTAFKIYFVDGVSPATGRWCLFLINKIFPLAYNPFFVEIVGLAFFCLSVTLWCIVFYRIVGDKISVFAYTIIGGVMLSSPILSEIVTYYLQNGIYLGYGVTALAVMLLIETFRTERNDWKGRMPLNAASGALLTAALGFYESFMIVFMMAAVMSFLLIRATDCGSYRARPLEWVRNTLIVCILGMMFREIITRILIALFHLEGQMKVLKNNGMGDILGNLAGWFSDEEQMKGFLYILKEFLVKYYFNAVVYAPVMILVLALAVSGIWSLIKALKKKDGWVLAAWVGILLLPWLLPVIEGVATYYRSSQYIPLLTAFAVLIAAWELKNVRWKGVRCAALFFAFLLLYQQGYEMNKWLYVDAMKYEDAKRTMDNVALYLQANVDTDKPVCVVGSYQASGDVLSDVYCPAYSKKYVIISYLVRGLDEGIFEKYDSERGYAAAETPRLSLIKWGATAFYGFDRELIKYWKTQGFDFVEDGNQAHYEQAKEFMADGPAWPRAGSVVELEDYIIVNFGNHEQ